MKKSIKIGIITVLLIAITGISGYYYTQSTKVILPVIEGITNPYAIALTTALKSYSTQNYSEALKYYDAALTYFKTDEVYIGKFYTHVALNEWDKALRSIDEAIKLKPQIAEYWNIKLMILDDKTDTSYATLKIIYDEAYSKVGKDSKIDLVTNFARISENNDEKEEALKLWQEASTLNPDNAKNYQEEIIRLSK